MTTKTLEAWVALANLDQRSGSAMCVQTLDGQQFDAIVYAEHQPRRWMAGSDWGRRTVDVAGPLEETADGKLIHVAVVYRGDGEISVYRNGQRYGEPYRTKALQPFEGGKAEILFGPRCHPGTTCLAGSIARAQLYDVALSSEQIAVLATDAPPTGPPRRADPSTPKPRSLAGLTNQNDPPPPAKSGNKPRFPSEMRGGTGGDWAIEGDELVRRPDLPESTILFGDPAWTEYDFSFDAKVRKGWSAWFFFGYQDEKNFHWYGIGAWDNTWELVVTVEGGKWGKRQCERRVAIPGDIWQQIRISVRGKKGRCFRNGESVGEFSMPHLLKGRLGFVVEKKASYRFRNIMVKSPSGKVLLKGLPDVGEASAPDDREAGTDKPRSLGDLVTDAKANSQQLTTTEAFSLKRHEAAVTRLAFHRTQPLLASAGKDGCVLLWSLQTRAPLELHKFREEAWAIKFSPDGAMLAFANRNWWGSRLLFKTLAGQQLNEIKDFKNGGGAVASIAYSPDGRLFAAGQDDGTIRLWDVIQFREIPPVALGEGHNIYGLAFGTYTVDRKSKRAEYLLAAGGPDRMVRTLKATLDNKNGGQWTFWQTKVQFPTPGPVIGVRFSPNGTLLGTTRLGGRVSLYNPNTGESVRELAAGVRNNPAEWIAFHPQRPWCVTAHKNEQVARIWNTDTAELLCELKGHAGGVMCAEFSPDGRHVATASEDLSIKLWNLAGKDVPAAPTRAKNTKPAVPIVGD
ncbi:MAG TPA: LamG-like jellyroll fold domain-containing protein [Pirellulales bacterium]|nr:LamG-like jellyroll fold domain-containing protein [Pirellulales bacterium]